MAGLASGCSAPLAPLRVGLCGFLPFELMALARSAGHFREVGAEVRVVEFEDLSDAQRAFEQGKIDGLGTTLVEVLITRSSSQRDLRVLRVASVSDGAEVLLAPRSVASVAELRGRRIAVEIASLSHYLLARALDGAGLTLADVVPVSMAQDAMPDALAHGEVHAILTYPPGAAALRGDARWQVLFSSHATPGEVVGVYAFDRQVVETRPADLRAFFTGIDRALQTLQTRPQESCRTMAPRVQIDAARFCSALADGIRLVPPTEQDRYVGVGRQLQPHIERVAQALARNGLVRPHPQLTRCIGPLP